MTHDDIDRVEQFEAISALRDGLVTTCNDFFASRPQLDGVVFRVNFMALVSALADFIAHCPEEQQANVYKTTLSMLEHAYVVNLTKGNL